MSSIFILQWQAIRPARTLLGFDFESNLVWINSWLGWILICTIVRASALEVSDRSSVSFGEMLQRQTSQWCGSYWPPVPASLHWNGYGCWCGLGGAGTPVDQFDATCKAHDECWEKHRNPGEICHGAQQGHLLGYRWQWTNNQVCQWFCLTNKFNEYLRVIVFMALFQIICNADQSTHYSNFLECRRFICECDKKFAIGK